MSSNTASCSGNLFNFPYDSTSTMCTSLDENSTVKGYQVNRERSKINPHIS